MKKVQVEDFATSSRALDKYNIDGMPALEPRANRVPDDRSPEQASSYSPTRPSTSDQRAPEPERGGLRRHSYEVWGDQVMALNVLAHKDKMNGKKGSMSEMLREAIDDYLQKRKGQPE